MFFGSKLISVLVNIVILCFKAILLMINRVDGEKLREEHTLSGHSVAHSACGIDARDLFRRMLEPNRMSVLHNR